MPAADRSLAISGWTRSWSIRETGLHVNVPSRSCSGTDEPLSEQLHDLAEHAKHAEDLAAAVDAENRAALDSQREQLKSKLEQGGTRAMSEAAAKQKTPAWWNKVRSDINDRFTEMRAKRDELISSEKAA
jgi:hypothetical protein